MRGMIESSWSCYGGDFHVASIGCRSAVHMSKATDPADAVEHCRGEWDGRINVIERTS